MIETTRLTFPLERLKLDPQGGVDTMSFSGYGAVFDNVDAYGDMIEPGAFSAWLADVQAGKQDWPAMLSQHGGMGLAADDMTPVGIWTEMGEDRVGLKVAGKLADTPRGRELYELMKMKPRPAINGLSIGYIAREFEMGANASEPRRKLKRIDVVEISPVTFPANGKARVSSVKSRPSDIRSLEAALRETCGFSAREARKIAAGGWPALMRADEGAEDQLEEIVQALRRNIETLRA